MPAVINIATRSPCECATSEVSSCALTIVRESFDLNVHFTISIPESSPGSGYVTSSQIVIINGKVEGKFVPSPIETFKVVADCASGLSATVLSALFLTINFVIVDHSISYMISSLPSFILPKTYIVFLFIPIDFEYSI